MHLGTILAGIKAYSHIYWFVGVVNEFSIKRSNFPPLPVTRTQLEQRKKKEMLLLSPADLNYLASQTQGQNLEGVKTLSKEASGATLSTLLTECVQQIFEPSTSPNPNYVYAYAALATDSINSSITAADCLYNFLMSPSTPSTIIFPLPLISILASSITRGVIVPSEADNNADLLSIRLCTMAEKIITRAVDLLNPDPLSLFISTLWDIFYHSNWVAQVDNESAGKLSISKIRCLTIMVGLLRPTSSSHLFELIAGSSSSSSSVIPSPLSQLWETIDDKNSDDPLTQCAALDLFPAVMSFCLAELASPAVVSFVSSPKILSGLVRLSGGSDNDDDNVDNVDDVLQSASIKILASICNVFSDNTSLRNSLLNACISYCEKSFVTEVDRLILIEVLHNLVNGNVTTLTTVLQSDNWKPVVKNWLGRMNSNQPRLKILVFELICRLLEGGEGGGDTGETQILFEAIEEINDIKFSETVYSCCKIQTHNGVDGLKLSALKLLASCVKSDYGVQRFMCESR